jgi:mannose/fructose/N-acetylgalactosamine-specific phosphotransferase system component IIC
MTTAAVAMAAAAGGIVALERKIVAQLMISRPIVVAPLIAAILGDANVGLVLGIPLELTFLGTASFGASTPYHETLAALFAAAMAAPALTGRHGDPAAVLPLAFFLSLPFALIGRSLEAGLERRNVVLVDRAEDILAHGHPGLASRQALLGLAGTALMGIVVTLLGCAAGPLLGLGTTALPAWLDRGLRLSWPLALGVSAALAIRAVRAPRGVLLSGITAAMVFGVWILVDLVSR